MILIDKGRMLCVGAAERQLSEYGEGGVGVDELAFKIVVVHRGKHDDALNECNSRPYAACDDCKQYAQQAGGYFVDIEILHAEAADKQGEYTECGAAFGGHVSLVVGLLVCTVAIGLLILALLVILLVLALLLVLILLLVLTLVLGVVPLLGGLLGIGPLLVGLLAVPVLAVVEVVCHCYIISCIF